VGGRLRELCRDGADQERLYALVYQNISSMDDLENNEVEFLVNYAMQDLRHYLYTKIGVYDSSDFDEERAREILCEDLLRNEEHMKGIVDEWFNWWLVKWRQRVRLAFGNNNEEDPRAKEVSKVMNNLPGDKVRGYLRFIVKELIEENELCSLDVIADFVLRSTVQELLDEYGKERALRILNDDSGHVRLRLLRKILEVTKSRQPIVILRVKLNPYQ
jgi:hypothetical protein